MTYYIQRDPPSIRRFDVHGNGQRWDGEAWTEHCSPEITCIHTGDEALRETVFAERYPLIPLQNPA